MSFQSREKRRRYKAAVKRSKRHYSDETAGRWFLTLVTRRGTWCAVCGLKLVKGGEMVYRHEPVEVRCVDCGGREPDSKGFRPSLRWKRAKRAAVRAEPVHRPGLATVVLRKGLSSRRKPTGIYMSASADKVNPMRCPTCSAATLRTYDSRPAGDDAVRRRRECKSWATAS